MRYYLKERIPENGQIYRDEKGRNDIEEILRATGFYEVTIDGSPDVSFGAYRQTRNDFEALGKGDILIVQLPVMTSSIIMRRLLSSLRKRGVQVFLFIHDMRHFLENNASLCKFCEGVVVNNERSAMELIKQKLDIKKIIPLGLFDYIIPDSISGSCGEYSLKSPVVVAGKLTREEAGYLYHLPDNCSFRLYGEGYEGKFENNVEFGGDYLPNDLPYMLKGSFGLVWDGTSPMTCLGIAGETMKIKNPLQLSLYLASGMPVIVWSESAIADFVVQKGCGFTISSLAEIGYRINAMSEKTYNKMRKGAEDVGIPMRDGCYTRRVILKMCDE